MSFSFFGSFFVVVVTAPLGQPHAVFGGFIPISGGRMLMCTGLILIIMAEEGPYIPMQCIIIMINYTLNVALACVSPSQ